MIVRLVSRQSDPDRTPAVDKSAAHTTVSTQAAEEAAAGEQPGQDMEACSHFAVVEAQEAGHKRCIQRADVEEADLHQSREEFACQTPRS